MAQLLPLIPGDLFKKWRDKINEFVNVVNLSTDGSPDVVNTLEDVYKYLHSAGIFTGFEVTDNLNGTIDVATGEALIRWGTTGLSDPIYGIKVAATSAIALTDNDVNFIYLDYNAGSPSVKVDIDKSVIDGQSKILIATVSREGTNLTILESQTISLDFANSANEMLKLTEGFKPVVGGNLITDKTNMDFEISAGDFYWGLQKVSRGVFDTTTADVFEYYYTDGVGGWNEIGSQSQIDRLKYDNGSGTLATATAGYYVPHWVYLKLGTSGYEVYVIYGSQYATLLEAQESSVPTGLPAQLGELGSLAGLIVTKQDDATIFADVKTAYGESFSSSIESHITDISNPHAVTKTQVGLGNVDNTSDLNKPVSTAQLVHNNSTSNPHAVTKAQVGLGNVDNTSDANKPVSTAQQAALDLKIDTTEIGASVQGYDANTSKTDVSQEYTAQQNFDEVALTDATTIAWNVDTAQEATVTLTASRILGNPTGQRAGAWYHIRVVQGGTGNNALTYESNYKGGTAGFPVLSTAVGAEDVLAFRSNGTFLQFMGAALGVHA